MRYITKEHLAVIKAASTDPSRYVINGVLLEETEKGLKAIATDGRLLAIVESESEHTEKDFPVIDALKNAQNTSTKAIVNVKALKQAAKGTAKRSTLPILREIAIKMSEKETVLASTDLETNTILTPKNIEGQYVNYEQVIPQDSAATFKIAFNPLMLSRALEIANQVMDKHSVELQFSTPLSPVKIVGKRNGFKVTIVVMPMKV